MKIDELAGLSTRQLLSLYGKGEVSPVAVMRTTLDHAGAVNGTINALFHVVAD